MPPVGYLNRSGLETEHLIDEHRVRFPDGDVELLIAAGDLSPLLHELDAYRPAGGVVERDVEPESRHCREVGFAKVRNLVGFRA